MAASQQDQDGSEDKPSKLSSLDRFSQYGTAHLAVPHGSRHQSIASSSMSSAGTASTFEDEILQLPVGWSRHFDLKQQRYFFVDMSSCPARTTWLHPYEDERYLSSLLPLERERAISLNQLRTQGLGDSFSSIPLLPDPPPSLPLNGDSIPRSFSLTSELSSASTLGGNLASVMPTFRLVPTLTGEANSVSWIYVSQYPSVAPSFSIQRANSIDLLTWNAEGSHSTTNLLVQRGTDDSGQLVASIKIQPGDVDSLITFQHMDRRGLQPDSTQRYMLRRGMWRKTYSLDLPALNNQLVTWRKIKRLRTDMKAAINGWGTEMACLDPNGRELAQWRSFVAPSMHQGEHGELQVRVGDARGKRDKAGMAVLDQVLATCVAMNEVRRLKMAHAGASFLTA